MSRLPRLSRDQRIVDGVMPSMKHQRDWQAVVEAIEAQDGRSDSLEAAIAIIQARLTAAGIP